MTQEKRYTKAQITNIASDILEAYGNDKYPVRIIRIAQNIGLKVYETTFDREDVSGMIKARENAIYISRNDNIKRQRFSIAHELGHYILHYKGKLFDDKDQQEHISYRDNISSLGFSIKEIEANFFAANILMPEFKIKEFYQEGYSIEEMAQLLNVSETAMSHRLDFLGFYNE